MRVGHIASNPFTSDLLATNKQNLNLFVHEVNALLMLLFHIS